MKTIYLLRHAKAEKGKDKLPDEKRSLTKSGKKDAQKMAEEFASKVMLPGLIITSSAKRAVETANIFAKQLGYKKKNIKRDETVYENSQEGLFSLIKNVDDSIDSAMIVGHNPSFNEFSSGVIREAFKQDIPSGALVGIKVNVQTWKNLAPNKGDLIYYSYPGRQKEVNKKYAEYRKKLETDLSDMMKGTLANIDTSCAESVEHTILKASQSLAKKFVKAMKEEDIDIPVGPQRKKTVKSAAASKKKPPAKQSSPRQKKTSLRKD